MLDIHPRVGSQSLLVESGSDFGGSSSISRNLDFKNFREF